MLTSAPPTSLPSSSEPPRLERRATRAASASGPSDLPTLQQRLASLVRRVARGDSTLASTSAALGRLPHLSRGWK